MITLILFGIVTGACVAAWPEQDLKARLKRARVRLERIREEFGE